MGKELSEMTLEELWELFPIVLVEHNDKWNLSPPFSITFLQSFS